MLFDVISEESINVDYPSFNKLFLEFGQTNGNRHPLMEMNKQFIRTLLSTYGRNTPSSKSHSQPQFQIQNNNMSTNMPSRPQGARSKNVSFDEQLELHRQHFQQFASPPPPTPPIFEDDASINPSGNLDILMQKALSERKYDAVPQFQSQPARKLHIGSVIEDEKHKEDVIDIDKLTIPIPTQPQPQPPPIEDVSTFGFFSKLKTVKKETTLVVEQDPSSNPTPIFAIDEIKDTIKDSINMSTNAIEDLQKTVAQLSQEVSRLSAEVDVLKNTYSPELKETPPLQIK